MKNQVKSTHGRPGNRQALIDATLDSIAEIGLIRTSVSEIIARAGLSRGMIHLHFGGKDNLIVEAARAADRQYYETLNKNLSAAEPEARYLIEASVRSDLSQDALNRRTVCIWYEFRGAARTNPNIAQFSDTRDARLRALLQPAVLDICRSEGAQDPDTAARDMTVGLISLLEGMWTDFLLHPSEFNRDSAARVVFRFLSAAWPGSFTLNGATPAIRPPGPGVGA